MGCHRSTELHPEPNDTFTTTYSNLKNQFLESLRYKEHVQFIYSGALGQYLFAKLEEKINLYK